MGTGRGKTKKTRKSIMKSTKGEYYAFAAVLGICIACLPLLVVATQRDQGIVHASETKVDLDEDLEAAESQNAGMVQQRMQPQRQQQPSPVALPTAQVPVAVAPPAGAQASVVPPPAGFTIPKTDLASEPSYTSRYSVPAVDPWREHLPYSIQQFRRRATDDDGLAPEDDHQPQESKGKKHSPSVLKRVRNTIRNTGKAIVGAPSYILKRYKKYFGGSKKKKGGWKSWSPSAPEKGHDGWSSGGGGGWEEVEPSHGYYDEPSHYPSSDKGWKPGKGYDSHERRSDRDREYRESTGYRDYREKERNRGDYDSPPRYSTSTSRYRSDRDRPSKPSSNYREETHYDDYDGRKTTAYYGPSSRKTSSKRPSSSYRDDDY